MAKDSKVVNMKANTDVSDKDTEALDRAEKAQNDKLAEMKAAEDAVIAELVEKHALSRDKIDEAVNVETELSDPATGISTLVAAIDFYVKKGLTQPQIMFLAITGNSKVNQLLQEMGRLQEQNTMMAKELDSLMQAKSAEIESQKPLK